MRIGVVFPQTELGGDPGAVRAYGERVEELGYTHILAYDHVVGADARVHTGWSGPYDVHTTFHEPLVMFGFLAAVTRSVELVTGVIILPQRQTAPGGQAGRRGGSAQRWPAAARHRCRLERRRIRGLR
jgi:alkanesulfonate monooxygenase SsuD/methylene tetrahydromethanopterin reductase-like flavin-dependent oxidoreductase (luciferase family)